MKDRRSPADKKPWYRWWSTRVLGFLAAVALAVASGVATDVAKRALGTSPPASNPVSSPAPTSLSPPAGTTTPLLKVGEEIVFDDDEDIWVSDRPVDLTSGRREKLLQDQKAGGNAQAAYGRDMLDSGAFPTDSLQIDLNLTTDWPKQVRLTRIRMVGACGQPATGTLFYHPGGGAPEVIAKVGFDLDEPAPVAREVSGNGQKFGGDFFADHVQYVSRNDGYAYRVLVRAKKHFCTFHLEVDTTDGDRSQTIKVDDHGQPFRISGVLKRPDEYGVPYPRFTAYQRLYVGGMILTGAAGWTPKDPRSYRP